MQGECERWGWWGRERERVSAGAQWPCPASLMCVVIRAHWWVCVPVGGAGAYLWLVMLWSAASDSPASPWPPVIQNMPLPARLLHERQRPDCWGSGAGGGGSNVTAQINLHRPGAWWTNVQLYCMFAFEPELKKHLLDYLHESPALWYFQEPCCLFSSLSQGNGSLRFHDTPVERGAL